MQRAVNLPVNEARCKPTGRCGIKLSCARFLAPEGKVGQPMADFSVHGMWTGCGSFYPLEHCPGPEPKQPTVHDCPKGLV